MPTYEEKAEYSKYKALHLNLNDGIMEIILSNNDKKNAVTHQMNIELAAIWEDLWLDPDVKVIVMTGDGSDFCSGIDLSALNARHETTPTGSPAHPMTRRARKHVMAILDCEKPVLAKVRGVAYGMGVNLALACDMVFASETARFCDSHVRAGMVAGDGGVLLWPLLIGMHRAKEYLMTGKPITARDAEQFGLINRCLPDDQLDAYVQEMAETLRDLPPHAVNYTKVSLNTAMKQMAASAFEASIAYELYTMGTSDFREATAAFVEKRRGRYHGL